MAAALARLFDLQVLSVYPLVSMEASLALFRILDQRDPDDVARLMRADPRVVDADVNTAALTQSDPHAPRQYALRLLGVDRAHGALRGRGIIVAVADTGVDTGHEDLRGAVAIQESLIEGQAQIDADPHGTAVAGIIAARRDNGLGIVGLAPEASIVALQACVRIRPGAAEASCAAHRVARAVDLAVAHRARILNLSLGGPRNRVVTRLIARATFVHGVAVVAAAGNNGPDGPALYPAALPGVTAVGATDSRDAPYERSNMGRQVAVLAPGVDTMTTLPGNRYLFVTGTSYAAAHVSGSLALLMEAARGIGTAEIVAALKAGATPLAGWSVGRVDLCRSLAAMQRADLCR